MIKNLAFATLLTATSCAVLAESFPSDLPPSEQHNIKSQGNNGFTYPEKTHLESDEIFHDVVFFYSNDMLDYFENNVEALTKYVEGAIEINNKAFSRQDIPLRRKIIGIVNIPEPFGYDDNIDGSERLSSLRRLYADSRYRFNFFFDASYVVALNRYYPEKTSSIGLAEVSGKYSWVSPYRGFNADPTLAHELGHNDGFIHDVEHYEGYSSSNRIFLAASYAVGASCGTFDSIMRSSSGNRSEAFISSPLVKNAQSEACGVENTSDAARAYLEALQNKIPQRLLPFANNKPSRAITGTASLSVLNPTVNEGQDIEVEVIFTGAELGDTVQVITRQGSADNSDFVSTLKTVYFDETSSVKKLTFSTKDDEDFEMPEQFIIELVYPNGLALDTASSSQTITMLSDDIGYPGTINFDVASLTLSEGQNSTLTLTRTNGTDGDYTVRVFTEYGTADANDFVAIDQEITFLNGETTKSLNLSINSDISEEPAETFTVRFTGNNLIVGSMNTVAVTVLASSAPPAPPKPASSNESSGGSFNLTALLLLLVAAIRQRTRKIIKQCNTL
ncbi:Calx-beta domain-containing protein [Rheinheimera sp. UJ63]|uniref:Calx-beta domain-containing protein n=1 Tax=Rheinheimera sp. UJ63 TaxID=2910157 RepID=UPI001F3F60CD|nr:Calx-beta domain-containing protein [Rheinheimera sp. UJ63]MCF4010590.1 GlyGly-CTERM sorting domain-containing protein [Rheinheimera sp. UJ63]